MVHAARTTRTPPRSDGGRGLGSTLNKGFVGTEGSGQVILEPLAYTDLTTDRAQTVERNLAPRG